MKRWWMNPVAAGKPTWKIARSAASQTSSRFGGTVRDISSTRNWKVDRDLMRSTAISDEEPRVAIELRSWGMRLRSHIIGVLIKLGLIFCSEGVHIFPVERGGASSPIQLSQSLRRSIRRTLQCLSFFCCLLTVSAWAQQQIVTQIRVIGNRQIPKETILARMFSRINDPYDPLTVERDFNSLWNTGYFENLRIEKEDSPKGVILERLRHGKADHPRDQLQGPEFRHPIGCARPLQERESRHVSVESKYDPTEVAHAIAVLKELLGEHGHQFATIKADIKKVPPASVQVNFTSRKAPRSR